MKAPRSRCNTPEAALPLGWAGALFFIAVMCFSLLIRADSAGVAWVILWHALTERADPIKPRWMRRTNESDLLAVMMLARRRASEGPRIRVTRLLVIALRAMAGIGLLTGLVRIERYLLPDASPSAHDLIGIMASITVGVLVCCWLAQHVSRRVGRRREAPQSTHIAVQTSGEANPGTSRDVHSSDVHLREP